MLLGESVDLWILSRVILEQNGFLESLVYICVALGVNAGALVGTVLALSCPIIFNR